jgi:hypothetical protein
MSVSQSLIKPETLNFQPGFAVALAFLSAIPIWNLLFPPEGQPRTDTHTMAMAQPGKVVIPAAHSRCKLGPS